MRKIINERGEEAISLGSKESPIRMKTKYPDTMNQLIGFIAGGNMYSYEIIKTIIIDSMVEKIDYENMLNAVLFYTNELIIKELKYANE